ncbi:hypothetical protein [Mesorhizobium sp.]|uniref:hypothetical protein n=1 Tax=Mesorhizobium sp. TaxID=1871066 RepID=UPI000FE8DC95|nr:hypothetical protein [Mesorhizobium sp.]RWE37462.1 MAG: hypothetical protein EOS77_02465 [Mesorhizobium sp.]
MTPFERFFAQDFQAMLDTVKHEPGLFTSSTCRIEDASWDRKAALLVWQRLEQPASECLQGCQYAKDVGMPEHSCGSQCQYTMAREREAARPQSPFEDLLG